jgi:hypothetical protein
MVRAGGGPVKHRQVDVKGIVDHVAGQADHHPGFNPLRLRPAI